MQKKVSYERQSMSAPHSCDTSYTVSDASGDVRITDCSCETRTGYYPGTKLADNDIHLSTDCSNQIQVDATGGLYYDSSHIENRLIEERARREKLESDIEDYKELTQALFDKVEELAKQVKV